MAKITPGDIQPYGSTTGQVPVSTGPSTPVEWGTVSGGGGGSGTVTSVALSLPTELTVSGSPITVSGTLSAVWANATANRIFAGPTTGSPGVPAFRALVAADIPSLSYVTSVALSLPAELTVSGSPITTAGTLSAVWASATQNYVFAAPSGSSGTPSFRALVAGDIPAIAESGVTDLTTDLGLKALKATTISTTAPMTGGGDLSTNRTFAVPTFVASGGSHAAGLVPDPGASAGSTKYLREDGTWNVVAGGGSGTGAVIGTGTEAAISGAAGDAYFPSDGQAIHRFDGTNWIGWGPNFPFTAPPFISPTTATTLSGNGGSITSGATSMLVASSAGFPATPFLCIIGTEDIKVTAVVSLTWTIVRGYNGTSAASHNDGVAVTLVNWEWVNKGAGSSVTQAVANAGLYLDSGVDSATTQQRVYKRLMGNTSSGDLQVLFMPTFGAALSTGSCGICLRESAAGRMINFILYLPSSMVPVIYSQRWTNATTYGGVNDIGGTYPFLTPLIGLRFTISGANILFKYSMDGGAHWTQLLSIAKTTPFTTAPDEWGIVVNSVSATANGSVGMNVLSFKEA
jgi:hypothetical protein